AQKRKNRALPQVRSLTNEHERARTPGSLPRFTAAATAGFGVGSRASWLVRARWSGSALAVTRGSSSSGRRSFFPSVVGVALFLSPSREASSPVSSISKRVWPTLTDSPSFTRILVILPAFGDGSGKAAF